MKKMQEIVKNYCVKKEIQQIKRLEIFKNLESKRQEFEDDAQNFTEDITN